MKNFLSVRRGQRQSSNRLVCPSKRDCHIPQERPQVARVRFGNCCNQVSMTACRHKQA
jgi:hypothetical protein